ncbi:hypothetical protein [uncultured Phascolarctobacterium sp.]|jgi:hypothetical protein|uniref:hypothetical protein n=1 Tax=uncultured Phascolarctobacterium sp. TaxID=512296 RepID=UPI0025DEE0F7|nr:hypothetical protein [uncultured Phascolarctobacterium sp.]
MYEPIIDPMVFYWIDLVEKLQLTPICVVMLGLLLTFFLSLYFIEADLSTKQENKIQKIVITIFSVLFIATSLLAFLAPSKDTMYKMLIAKQVTPHNLQVTGETVDKALDKVAEKIIKVAKEIKSE